MEQCFFVLLCDFTLFPDDSCFNSITNIFLAEVDREKPLSCRGGCQERGVSGLGLGLGLGLLGLWKRVMVEIRVTVWVDRGFAVGYRTALRLRVSVLVQQ
jgi:hypothetical protein